MESLTHALIGAGFAALSGEAPSLTNPIYLGCIIGAIAPDFDIVLYLKGELPYLKHHRGFSHSLPGLALISLAITAVLGIFYPIATFWPQLLLWTFLGALSHSLMDVLNSYGAKLFWPLINNKTNLNLLMIFDPFLIILFSALWFLPGNFSQNAQIIWIIFGLYLLFRLLMREKLKKYLSQSFKLAGWQNSFILPAIYGMGTWDFAVTKNNTCIVGQVNFFNGKVLVRERLPIAAESKIIKKALQSKLGEVFQDFTPHFHITHSLSQDCHVIKFLDLRYYIRNDFLHRGTLILDKQFNLVEGIFQPYHKNRRIRVI